jgi:hypothetical protein
MALIYTGMKCSICHQVIENLDDIVATSHFLSDDSDPLYRYSDTAMHPECFSSWVMRGEFVDRFNSFWGSCISGDCTFKEMQPDGRIKVKPALVVPPEFDYKSLMPHDHQHNPTPNVNAARSADDANRNDDGEPADLNAAWAKWSSHIQNVDERGMALLRVAFEAGWGARREID